MMFSPIGNQIASAGSDKLIKLWHPTNLKMGDHTKSVEITTIEPIVWITGEVFDQSKIAQVMIGDHIVELGSNLVGPNVPKKFLCSFICLLFVFTNMDYGCVGETI